MHQYENNLQGAAIGRFRPYIYAPYLGIGSSNIVANQSNIIARPNVARLGKIATNPPYDLWDMHPPYDLWAAPAPHTI
jgi:hypothetical protein